MNQYEEDIPRVTPRCRRFRIHVGRCRRCPQAQSGAPPAADEHCHRGGEPATRPVRRIVRTTFSLSVTRGGLSQIADRVAKALAPTYDALVEQVQSAPVAADDETGWTVGGDLQWLWVFVTPKVTV